MCFIDTVSFYDPLELCKSQQKQEHRYKLLLRYNIGLKFYAFSSDFLYRRLFEFMPWHTIICTSYVLAWVCYMLICCLSNIKISFSWKWQKWLKQKQFRNRNKNATFQYTKNQLLKAISIKLIFFFFFVFTHEKRRKNVLFLVSKQEERKDNNNSKSSFRHLFTDISQFLYARKINHIFMYCNEYLNLNYYFEFSRSYEQTEKLIYIQSSNIWKVALVSLIPDLFD